MKKLFLPALCVLGVTALAATGIKLGGVFSAPEGDVPVTTPAEDITAPLAEIENAKLASAPVATANIPVADFGEAVTMRTEPVSGAFEAPEAAVKARESYKAPRRRTVSSIDDICGDFVQMSYSLVSSSSGGYDMGCWATITKVSDDSVAIERFLSNFSPSLTIKGKVDLTAGTVTFPSQVVTNDATYGDISFATCTTAGKPDRDTPVVATITDEGLSFGSAWWGLFVDSGTYADRYMYAMYNTTYERCNAQLVYGTSSGSYYYKVRVEQTMDNVATVKNFANMGMGIEVSLSTDKVATFPTAIVGYTYYNSAVCALYPISNLTYNDSGSLSTFSYGITSNPATADNVISWGEWSLMVPSTVWYGARTSGSITLDSGSFTYPTAVTANWEGEGTEASPYLIKTLDDLRAMAEVVNADTNYVYANQYGSTYTRVLLGKHFKLMNDIDMSSTSFVPIGCDWKHFFAGSFDGNGHTLSGMYVSRTGTYGFGGLFGRTDSTTVIKDLTVTGANISGSYFTGGIVGWSLGQIINCQVTNSTISTSGTACGGIAGDCTYLDGCTVTNCTITGTNGYVGGITGEVICQGTTSNPIARGVLNNCHVIDCTLNVYGSSTAPAGGVTGNAHTADVTNCSFKGYLNGQYPVGGYYPEYVYAGGVAGMTFGAKIEKCFSTGILAVYGSSARVGGLVGMLRGDIKDCYASGYVWGYSTKCSGGLTGNVLYYQPVGADSNVKSTATNCFCATYVKAETYLIDNDAEPREIFGTVGVVGATDPGTIEDNVTVTNCYYDKQLTNFGGKNYAATTAMLTATAGIEGYSSDVWVFTAGAYPRIKGLENTATAQMASSAINFNATCRADNVMDDTGLTALGDTKFYFVGSDGYATTVGTYAKIVDNNKIEIGTEAGTETLAVMNGSAYYTVPLTISPRVFEGSGLEDQPFLIKTKADLIKLSELTTTTGLQYPDTYFKICNDIDLEMDAAFLGISADGSDAHQTFMGTIDGDGHTIHRMPIHGLVWNVEPDESTGTLGTVVTNSCEGYKGFIGRLGTDGVLKNINFDADCSQWVWATTGVAVGYCYGTIDNVRNYASIKGVSCWIGGIAGQLIDGTITNCFNAGDIGSSYMDAGGIVGAGYGRIANCMNTGDIFVYRYTAFRSATSSFNYAGGIAGGTTAIGMENCVNTGHIYSATQNAGGITGSLSSTTTTSYQYTQSFAKNCLNFGIVETANLAYIGGIAGNMASSEAEQVGNWYDKQILPYGGFANKAIDGNYPCLTDSLTSGKLLTGMDAEIWDVQAGMYPVLKQFASEPSVIAARQIVVTMPDDMTAADLRGNSGLAKTDGLAWSLVKAANWTISGDSLIAPATVAYTVTDTLVGTLGTITKRIPIAAQPLCPVAGDGTEENPYLITSTNDWNSFAEWQQIMGDDMTDKFAKVTADLDFTQKDFVQFGSTVTAWNGTFDGDGHTVSGISLVTATTYTGPFNIIQSKGVLKNITFEGIVTTTVASVGGVVGDFYGKMENVVSKMNVSVSGTTARSYIAGVAARSFAGAEFTKVIFKGTVTSNGTYTTGICAYVNPRATFTDCGNEGTVSYTGTAASAYVAGIAGYCYPSTFIRCYNTGKVEVGTPTTSAYVAGLVATLNAKAGQTEGYIFQDCYNTSDITAAACPAGLVCNATAASSTTLNSTAIHASGCYNTGKIYSAKTAAVSSTSAAGLFSFYTPGSVIEDCYNTGDVTNDKSVYSAGITGYYKGSANDTARVVIRRCYNTGKITAWGNQGGGIIAYIQNYTTIDSCYNTGDIVTGNMGGGIASCFAGTSSVMTNCWNSGNITGSNSLGGLFGWGGGLTVKNCYNTGNVTGNQASASTATLANNAYGIGGLAGRGDATFTDCYNLGDVSGECQVGGLIGRPTKIKTGFSNCYNAGKVSAAHLDADGNLVACPDTCGYIIGVSPYNASYWTTNVIENTYYVTDAGSESNHPAVEGVTGLTTAELCAKAIEGMTSIGDYCLPVIPTNCGDQARMMAIRVLAPTDYTLSPLKADYFYIGFPEDALIAFSAGDIYVNKEGDAHFTTPYTGVLTITINLGDYSRQITFDCEVTSTGIEQVGEGREVISEEWYTVSGIRVLAPVAPDGKIYIVRQTYSDGTTATFKTRN